LPGFVIAGPGAPIWTGEILMEPRALAMTLVDLTVSMCKKTGKHVGLYIDVDEGVSLENTARFMWSTSEPNIQKSLNKNPMKICMI
jgi:hypothetical protein